MQTRLFALPSLLPLLLSPRTAYNDDVLFHSIDTGTRGLKEVSIEPYIFTVDDFLSSAECEALISKMDQSVAEEQASSEKLSALGERTSRSVVPQNAEVAGLRSRLAALVNVQLTQMQPLKITRYDAGGVFMRHTDCTEALREAGGAGGAAAGCAAAGGTAAGGAAADADTLPNRMCTVLIYLNDVPSGGHTCWRWRDADPGFYVRQRARRQGAPPLVERGAGWASEVLTTSYTDDYFLLTADYLLLTTYYLLLPADYLLLTIDC